VLAHELGEAETRTRNIELVLEYHGASFAGWQVQPHARTVMGELERAIAEIIQEQVRVVAASRTDAGVHALGQVSSFRTQSRVPTEKLWSGLNALLPDGVAVRRVREVDEAFHARFSARAKHYRYRILTRPTRSPIEASTSWHVPVPLDVERMQLAAAHLEGEQDFSALATAPRGGDDSREGDTCVRRLHLVQVGREVAEAGQAELVTIDVVGDGFLYKMVRTIVGTLVLVGKGKRDPGWVRSALRSKQRKQAGPTAPPQGLFLLRVFYEEDVPNLGRYLEGVRREGDHHRSEHADPRQREGVRGAEGQEARALL
jgi:tRNA pseudouridine38-40 synthase